MRAEGIELNTLALPVEETFFRMLRDREFDCAEMSLSSSKKDLIGVRARSHDLDQAFYLRVK